MRRLYLLIMVIAIGAFCALAKANEESTVKEVTFSNVPTRIIDKGKVAKSTTKTAKAEVQAVKSQEVRKAVAKTESDTQMVPVQIALVYDADEFHLSDVFYMGEGVNPYGWDIEYELDEDNILTVQMPEGTFDIMLQFNRMIWLDRENWYWVNGGFYCYILEDVDVSANTPLQSADVAECHSIPMSFTFPDGTPVTLGVERWTGSDLEVVQDGNLGHGGASLNFYNSKYNERVYLSIMFGGTPTTFEDIMDGWEYWKVKVNTVSDKWHFVYDIQLCDMDIDNLSTIITAVDPTSEGINIVASDYTNIPFNFDTTDTKAVEIGVNLGSPKGLVSDGMGTQIVKPDVNFYYAEEYFTQDNPKNDIICEINLYNYTEEEYYYDEEWEWGEYYYYGTMSPYIQLVDNNWLYKVKGFFSVMPGYENQNSTFPEWYSGHSGLSTYADQTEMKFAQNVPVLISSQQNSVDMNDPSIVNKSLYLNHRGQLGEYSFNLDIESIIKYNGEIVKTIDDDLYTFNTEWNSESHENGIMEYDGVISGIDLGNDIEGISHCTIISDQTKDDFSAPTLTALQPRNISEITTNKFDNPDEGLILFTAGDYKYEEEWVEMWEDFWYPYSWYVCQKDFDVKVECAPYQSDDWTELDCEEDADLYTESYGCFFKATTKDLATTSENGWFDLRITLTDPSGNTQTQVISPMFYIDSLSGISTLRSEDKDIAPEYYRLDGIHIDHPTVPGIYIERRGTTSRKIVI